MWGTCFGNKRAMIWPFLRKGAAVYTQQCEIWHGKSLGTLFKIQYKQILRTIWGPCFVHKKAVFWPFLGKGATGYTQLCEIWHGTSPGILTKIQVEPIGRSMFWPCLAISRKGGYRIHPATWNLAWNIPGHNDRDLGSTNYKDHVKTMVWP